MSELFWYQKEDGHSHFVVGQCCRSLLKEYMDVDMVRNNCADFDGFIGMGAIKN